MSSIWLMQCRCENGHCLVAGIYDDFREGAELRARELLDLKLARLVRRCCVICKSDKLSFDTGRSICKSLREAQLVLADPAAKARGAVDLLDYLNAESCRLFCGKTYHGACLLDQCPRRAQR